MAATIKLPIIGVIAKTLQLNQGEIKKLSLNEICIPTLDISPYIGNYKIVSATSSNITGTGPGTAHLSCPQGKRWVVYMVNVRGTAGTFTTNSASFGITNNWGVSVASAVVLQMTTADIGPAYATPFKQEFQMPIVMNIGDRIDVSFNVNAFTTGPGTITTTAYVQEFDV